MTNPKENKQTTLTSSQFFGMSVHIGAHYILRFKKKANSMFADNPIILQCENLGKPSQKRELPLLVWHWFGSEEKGFIQPTPSLENVTCLVKDLVAELTDRGDIQPHLCTKSLYIPGFRPIPLS